MMTKVFEGSFQDEVLWLDVSVNEASSVEMVQCETRLKQEINQGLS